MIKLSILVPAFEYPRGIERIVRRLVPLPPEVQLIISDDSSGTMIQDFMAQYTSESITYTKNTPSKGAIANWNSLLDNAQGEFVLLLHHDELPLGVDFLDRLLNTLRHTSNDVLLMDVLLLDRSLIPIRRHVPSALRDLIIHWVPGYLFCRNVIGPTAALVVRRAVFPKFNTRLKWLVDVDMYYRLRKTTRRWQTIRGIEIGSVQGDNTTITQTLQSNLKQLEQTERLRLSAENPEVSFWINLQQKQISGKLEAIFWGTFRAFQTALSLVRKPKRIIK